MGRLLRTADRTTAAQLHELDDAEAGNAWHLLAAAGESLLVSGLVGACYLLWRQTQADRTSAQLTAAVKQRTSEQRLI